MAALTDEKKFELLRFKLAETELARVWREFENAGLNPILIKGWAAAQYYPEPSTRALGDIDLAFSADEYDRAVEIQNSKSLTLSDIHRELRHLDTERWERLFERSRRIECEGALIRVLSPEEHLRVLCVHWLNDGGAYFHRLNDIANLLTSTREEFDWNRCLSPLSEIRRNWIRTAVALADLHLEQDLGFVPFADRFGEIPDWLQRTLKREWESGYRLVPLHFVLREPKQFWRQLLKRIPPNALQATIGTESAIDAGSRFPIILKDFLLRLGPSYKRVVPALRHVFSGK
jgi:hypothetical protein